MSIFSTTLNQTLIDCSPDFDFSFKNSGKGYLYAKDLYIRINFFEFFIYGKCYSK